MFCFSISTKPTPSWLLARSATKTSKPPYRFLSDYCQDGLFFHHHYSSSLSSRLNRGSPTLNQHVSISWLPGQVDEEVLVDHVGLLAEVRAAASSLSTISSKAEVSAYGSRENTGIPYQSTIVHSIRLPLSNVTQSLTAAVPTLHFFLVFLDVCVHLPSATLIVRVGVDHHNRQPQYPNIFYLFCCHFR